MYKLMAIMCGLFLLFTAARGNAQTFHAFGGISYSGYDPNVAPKTSLYGWNGSLEIKVLPFLGFVADSSGHYGNETFTSLLLCRGLPPSPPPNCLANASVSLYTFTAGPQVSLPLGRFKPYAHALFGAALFRQESSEVDIGTSTSISFADELGGGVDVSIIPRVAWRVQADALQIWPSYCVGCLPGVRVRNSLRLSTGVVFGF